MGVGKRMLEFEILVRGLYRPVHLDITYDPMLRMSTSGSMSVGAQFIAPSSRAATSEEGAMNCAPTIQQWMDTLWQQKLAMAKEKNTPLFDTPLFRLVSAEARTDGTLHLVLGDTSYKEY